MRVILRICSILCIVAIVSCSNNDAAPSEPKASDNTIQTEVPKETVISKKKLIDDLTYYKDEKSLVINGKEHLSKFIQIEFHPFGFYVPETMEVFSFEDGSHIGLNNAEFISLIEVDRLSNPNNIQESIGVGGETLFVDEELSIYEEYIGSTIDSNGAVRKDGFLVKHVAAPDTVIDFRYFDKNKETVLPTFIEVAKNIKYIDQ